MSTTVAVAVLPPFRWPFRPLFVSPGPLRWLKGSVLHCRRRLSPGQGTFPSPRRFRYRSSTEWMRGGVLDTLVGVLDNPPYSG